MGMRPVLLRWPVQRGWACALSLTCPRLDICQGEGRGLANPRPPTDGDVVGDVDVVAPRLGPWGNDWLGYRHCSACQVDIVVDVHHDDDHVVRPTCTQAKRVYFNFNTLKKGTRRTGSQITVPYL